MKMRTKLAALLAAITLAACGGGDDPIRFSSMVSFGDSLSDVGTYKVGTVAALGGGKFTVNGPDALNWTERIATSIGVAAPCAAQTGLLPNVPGFTGAPVTDHPECTNYAQGSARVSQVFAPGSASLQAPPFSQTTIGLMAVPLTQQIATHLGRRGGSFTGDELVTVMAGGNDVFMNVAGVAAAAAGGTSAVGAALAAGWPAAVQNDVAGGGAAAVNAASAAAVAAMGQAGTELANLIKSQVLGKGARFVVVVNLPDVSQTPLGLAGDAQTRELLSQMVLAFNGQLAAGLTGTVAVLTDLYNDGRARTANPGQFGLTNVTTPACDTTSPANPLAGSSLACTAASTIPGDTSRFLYADAVHPTPYGYQLIAESVQTAMKRVGWF